MTPEEIIAIATQTRHDFENKTLQISYLTGLVHKHLSYMADAYKDGLTDWIEQTIADFPLDNCELASAVLLDRIGKGKIVYGRYNHEPIGSHNKRKTHAFWAQVDNKENIALIADITADQYNGPTLYIGPLITPWATPDWNAM